MRGNILRSLAEHCQVFLQHIAVFLYYSDMLILLSVNKHSRNRRLRSNNQVLIYISPKNTSFHGFQGFVYVLLLSTHEASKISQHLPSRSMVMRLITRLKEIELRNDKLSQRVFGAEFVFRTIKSGLNR